MQKRILSLLLSFVLVLTCCVIIPDVSVVTADAAASSIDYGLVDNVQYGQILHCWNWSFDNIRKNLPLIASQGFTAVQTSPIQSSKESTRESWSSVQNSAWVYYQPISFNIEQNSWNALGTKSQFEAMCTEAHKYGIKVIVDAVFNHMANDSSENTINPQITSDLKDDENCWYSVTWNTSNWEDRYDVTHNCLSGFPDLNTSNPKVQNYAIGFLKECIDAGADGFRFDAVKHIETPSDAYGTASDFWPNVLGTATYHAQQTRGITPYYYGELLGSPGGGLSVTAYTDHMSVTDNNTGNAVRDAIAGGDAASACRAYISNGAAPNKSVQWNESHDTYYADNNSIWISNDNMKKTWAIVGSRAEVCGLYLARPENNQTTMLGDGDITAWADKEVKAINRFKNYFAGHPEYLAYSGDIVYNERGNTGVVLVNAKGGSTSVSVPAHRMYNGVYTDAITGNHFTVSNGTISGSIGDSGIAVVYSYPSTVKIDKNSQAFRGDTLEVTLGYSEATSGTYSINGDYAKSYTDGDVISVGCSTAYGEEIELLATATGGTTTDSTIRTYKKLHPDTDLKMYFNNGSKNWNQVYAYIYNEDGNKVSSWPGTLMTYDESLGLYCIDVPYGFETSKVVFNDGDGNQTPSSGGHSFNAYTSIYKDGSFYGYNTGISGNIYFKPSEKWLSDNARFAVYVWNSEGKTWLDLSDSNNDGIFEAKLPSGTWNECIFARMNPSTTSNNWDNIWNRTGDLGLSNNNNYFMIGDGWNISDGTWSIIDNSVINSESDAFLTGSFNAWSKTDTPFVFTDYNQAVASVDLPAGTYTFKLYKNSHWFGNPGTINDHTAGNGWSMCKNDSENCTLVASGGTYTFTLNTETLKITVDYEAKDVDPIETTEPTSAETDTSTSVETDITTDSPTESPSILPEGYYLVGTINGENCWGVGSLSVERLFSPNPNNAGEYMLNYKLSIGDEVKVVHYDGSKITRWYNDAENNYEIGASKAGDCDVYFRPEGDANWSYFYFTVIPRTVEETDTQTPTSAPDNVEEGYYLVGNINGVDCWGINTLSDDRKFVPNPNNAGEYMLNYNLSDGDALKVVYFDGTDYTTWYNNADNNYNIDSSKAGNCNIYFRPEGNSSWSYFYFTVIPNKVEETEPPTEENTEEPTQTPTEKPTDTPTEKPTEEETQPPTKPLKVENITVAPESSTAVLTWDAIEGATKYWVYKNVGGTYVVYCSVATNKAVVGSLKGDTAYQFKVVAVLSDGTTQSLSDADVVEFTTKAPVVVADIKTASAVTSIKLSWNKTEGAQKYWIYKAFEENGPFYVYDATTELEYTVKRLQPDTTYYFKVVPAILSNGMLALGERDAAEKITASTTSGDIIQVKVDDLTSTTATISWPQFANAKKYWVMFSTQTKSTSDLSKWTTWAETTDTSYTFKWREPGVFYHFTVVALYTDEETGRDETVNYVAASARMPYTDGDLITFTPVDDDTVTLTWSQPTDVSKVWVSYIDASGKETVYVSTTETTVTINLKNYKDYKFALNALDSTGNVGYITRFGGEAYHE